MGESDQARVISTPLDRMLVYCRSLLCNLLSFPNNPPVYHLYTWVERGTVRVKCLAQEHNTISQPGLKPGPLNPGTSALTMRPPCLHSGCYLMTLYYCICTCCLCVTACSLLKTSLYTQLPNKMIYYFWPRHLESFLQSCSLWIQSGTASRTETQGQHSLQRHHLKEAILKTHMNLLSNLKQTTDTKQIEVIKQVNSFNL